ncbi:MAG: DUF4384 domain-containing protein [Ignavibacteriales bacterium]|nr:DUF4384 domain-containing protein [Ignavibacteriales bacterium]
MIRALLSICLIAASLSAQEQGRWVKGKASSFGTDLKRMQAEAVKRARADALNQAGIIVSASSFRVQTESNTKMNDYYSQFTEATSRGIITQERNVKISDPVRITKASSKEEMQYQLDAELEASKRTTYREADPVELEITSTKEGYVTIFHVKNDTIQIAFPNGLSRNNKVQAKKKFVFPRDYELYLTVDDNEKTSNEEFIVVVTSVEIPAADVGDAKIVGDELVLPKLSLTEMSQWLFTIPLHQRAVDHVVLTVVK